MAVTSETDQGASARQRLAAASLLASALLCTREAGAQLAQTQPGATPSAGGAIFGETFFLQMGFSFMVGLAMGFALKVAFKIALLVIGLILLALFALQMAGIIHVDWGGMEMHYDGWTDGIGAAAGAFFDFAAENLTSAASFFGGLAVGLKL